MIVLGLGYREKVTRASFKNVLTKSGVTKFDQIAVLARKAHHPALQEFVQRCGVVPLEFDEIQLEGIQTHTISEDIKARFKIGSLSEALALYACRPNAKLVHNRIISDDGYATLAIASQTSQN